MSGRLRRSSIVVVATILLAACGGGGDTAGDAERFCGEVAANKKALIAPNLTAEKTPDEAIEALLDEYRRIGAFAPLAIEEEWDQLVAAYETAANVTPDDPQSEQAALEAIFRSEKAAVKVADWLKTNCDVRLGPIATIVGQVTTTVDPATTEAP